MWELDSKESWVPKNWCFWSVVLEKTLESPLDGKGIKPVNPKVDQFSSVQSLSHVWLHEPQHTRPLYPSPTPGGYPNSCPLSHWCHPTISSSVVPFSCLQSFPTTGSFQMSQVFASGGQSIGVSASTSVLPIEHPGLISFRMDWVSPCSPKTLKSLLQQYSSVVSILQCSAFFIVQFSHPYMTTGKTIALTRWTFVDKIMSLLYNMLSRLVITFLPRSKCI